MSDHEITDVCEKAVLFFQSRGLSYSLQGETHKAELYVNGPLTKKQLDCASIARNFCEFFCREFSRNFVTVSSVVNETGKNLFRVNCLDLMPAGPSPVIFGAIPCIRLNVVQECCAVEGHSTASVQAFVLQNGATHTDFFSTLEKMNWFFSLLGLHVSHIHFEVSEYKETGDPYEGVRISFVISGVTVGSALFYYKTPSGLPAFNCWFGVERICWALTGKPYYQCISSASGMLDRSDKYLMEDRLRTLVLLYMSGLREGNKNAPYRVKKLMKELIVNEDAINLAFFIRYYYRFWQSVMQCDIPLEEVTQRFLNDYQYLRAVHYCNFHQIGYLLKQIDRDQVDAFEAVMKSHLGL